jgi:ABC-type lipoprotein release transport system permease subunit
VVAAGAVAGWVLVWIVATRLFGVATDLRAFAAVPLALIGVAAISSWLPARHAASIDPVAALKHD